MLSRRELYWPRSQTSLTVIAVQQRAAAPNRGVGVVATERVQAKSLAASVSSRRELSELQALAGREVVKRVGDCDLWQAHVPLVTVAGLRKQAWRLMRRLVVRVPARSQAVRTTLRPRLEPSDGRCEANTWPRSDDASPRTLYSVRTALEGEMSGCLACQACGRSRHFLFWTGNSCTGVHVFRIAAFPAEESALRNQHVQLSRILIGRTRSRGSLATSN